jgi:hypothetical protein
MNAFKYILKKLNDAGLKLNEKNVTIFKKKY